MSEKEEVVKAEASFDRQHSVTDDESSRPPASSSNTTLMALRDSVDEFFDVPEPSDDEGGLETGGWAESPDMCFVVRPNSPVFNKQEN